MTTIVTKNGSGAPTSGDLVQGELAVDLTNKRLYTEDSGGSVIEVGSNPTTLTTGTFTSTGIDDNATSTAITIDSSENVGIGTDSPGAPLDVAANASGVTATLRADTAAGNFGTLNFRQENGTTSNGRIIWNNSSVEVRSDSILRFSTNGTERMRIDSSGNVGIGTTSPEETLEVRGNARVSAVTGGLIEGDGFLVFQRETASQSNAPFITQKSPDGATQDLALGAHSGGGAITFWTGASSNSTPFTESNEERMRIDSSGNLLVGTATTPSTTSFGGRIDGAGQAYFFKNVNGGSASVQMGGNAGQAIVRGDGDLENTNNSYGAISDIAYKENIVDASPQLDDIMAMRVRSYNLKSTGAKHIGVIAQELELTSPELVKTGDDGMKSVKYSVMYMKAIKAIQEQQEIIDDLRARVAQLEESN